jgi:hypothetical protein
MTGEPDTFAWPDAEVVVQVDWSGWRTARVRLAALEDIHWRQPAGARLPLIHAFVPCPEVGTGVLEHACEATTRPHAILVCVLKSHTSPRIFAVLARAADERATAPRTVRPCPAPS